MPDDRDTRRTFSQLSGPRRLTGYFAVAAFGFLLIGITIWVIWNSLGDRWTGNNSGLLLVETKPLDEATKTRRSLDISQIPLPGGSVEPNTSQTKRPIAPSVRVANATPVFIP